MIVGFTGTQHGMNALQKLMFVGVLARLCPTEFHHGDCIGADAEADALVREHAPKCFIVIHPPINPRMRAFRVPNAARKPKDYLKRNRDIVTECSVIIACPREAQEKDLYRSGTWSTVREARRQKKRCMVITPDGNWYWDSDGKPLALGVR